MRAIKFRAWDNVKNVMYYPGEEDLILFMLADEGFKVDEVIPDDSKSEGFYAERLEHLQFMQFTGLHDKNGVEIYEGDVLKMVCGFELRKGVEIDVVEWSERCLSFGCSDWLLGELSSNKTDGEQDFEVIGNIYENPELLEVPSC